ncbi:MAG: phosphoenolpyruvate-utilizing N-terminal domain-containing protein [Candidatus Binatia bacterium]
MDHIVQVVREHFHANVCYLYELRNGTLNVVAVDKADSSADKREPSSQQNLVARVVQKKEAIFAHETGAVPLIYQEKIVGVLTLQKDPPNVFTLFDSQFLEFIALQLSGAIQSLTIAERAKKKIEKERPTQIITGIAVSSGFGIGPAFFLHPGITSTGFFKSKPPPQSMQEEWNKVQTALRRTSEDLVHVEKNIKNKFSKDESSIFNSHRVILSDPSFLGKLENKIQGGKGALEAVGDVLQEFMHPFSEMKNSRLKETAVDLEELRQRIFENLLGMESRQEKEDWSGILVAKSLGPSDWTAPFGLEKKFKI